LNAISLRPYQAVFAQEIREAFRRHRRVVGVAPTGAGKTVVFSYIAKGAEAKGNDVLIAVHRARIVQQISKSLHAQGIRHGRIQRGYTQTDDLVQAGMILTIVGRLHRLRPPKLIIIDEGHHSVAATYLKLFAAFPDAKVLMVTATPERADGKGMKAVAEVMVQAPTIKELIALGALAPFKYLAPPQIADLSQVTIRGSDYAVDEMVAAMNKAVITGSAVQHYRKYIDGKTAVVFCVNVQHAKDVAEQFNAAGVAAASVDGKLDDAEVDRILDAVGAGQIKVVTSCELISEGVDVPGLCGAFLLTRTKSLSKLLQMIGRALRLKEDDGHAWIFDHAGNYEIHGLPDAPRDWSLEGRKKKKEGAVETTRCESCLKVFQTYPGWRKNEDHCEDAGDKCVLMAVESKPGMGASRRPEEQDGELAEVVSPGWAHGISIADAKGDDWKRLVYAAKTEEQLQEIARARGMKHGWVRHIMKARSR
jgi:DNA repair protein RadD